MLEIIPVGGFSEVGRNCVAINIDGEIIVLDMGLEMENYVSYTQDDAFAKVKESELVRAEAIPDMSIIKDKSRVKAICISHAHLDHVGGVPYAAHHFGCPVYGTPFTIEVLKEMLRDDRAAGGIPNKLVAKPLNSRFRITKNIEVEFVNVTHSTPETAVIVIHTKYGAVVYANDFKLDGNPVVGLPTNLKRLGELKVKVLIMDSLYAGTFGKCPSESIAREMLKDVLLGTNNKGKRVIVTTFSSHIARLKSIVQLANKMKRTPVFFGRSIKKYVEAAKRAKVLDLSQDVKIMRSGKDMVLWLKQNKNLEKYLFITTGHQGEPRAVLSRFVDENLFPFEPDDHVIFSCAVIPTPSSIENRRILDEKLVQKKVRLFTDIHVSGHAHREDHRDFVKLTRPENVIPVHGSPRALELQKGLMIEMGYSPDKVHILKNGQSVIIS